MSDLETQLVISCIHVRWQNWVAFSCVVSQTGPMEISKYARKLLRQRVALCILTVRLHFLRAIPTQLTEFIEFVEKLNWYLH